MISEDSEEIWRIRNNCAVRKWMVNTDIIPFESHKQFVEFLKQRADKDYFLIKNERGDIIGSVNIDYPEDNVSERGLFINPLFHKKGHASRSMKEFYTHAHNNWGIKKIKTKVKKDNEASNSLEMKLGAFQIEEENGYNVYMLNL